MMVKAMVKAKRLIVVDGPAASGKSTLARKLAWRLGLPFLSTGAMYRVVAWLALRRKVPLGNVRALARLAREADVKFRIGGGGASLGIVFRGRDITRELAQPEISRVTSSRIAPEPLVRRALVKKQRNWVTRRGLVAEGRDCGSVVFPEAPFKFFITARLEERARRRRHDLMEAGIRQSYKSILADMRRRDCDDRVRKYGTLKVMPDAWVIDNTHLVQKQTLGIMMRRIDAGVVV